MSIEIGILIAVVSFLIGYMTFMRTRDKDIRQDASEKAATNAQLSHIGVGVTAIQVKMEVSEERFSKLAGDVIRLDESTKSAHKRLDLIDGGRNERND